MVQTQWPTLGQQHIVVVLLHMSVFRLRPVVMEARCSANTAIDQWRHWLLSHDLWCSWVRVKNNIMWTQTELNEKLIRCNLIHAEATAGCTPAYVKTTFLRLLQPHDGCRNINIFIFTAHCLPKFGSYPPFNETHICRFLQILMFFFSFLTARPYLSNCQRCSSAAER